MQGGIDRILKSLQNENGESKMKTCPQCQKQLKDEAKFCGGCGYKFTISTNSAIETVTCPTCGNTLKAGAKFCGKCGNKVADSLNQTAQKTSAEIQKDASFIHWNVLPGQLAVKIDSKEIASYGRVKGLVVQDGVKALFFVNGKVSGELDSGSYEFKDFPNAVATTVDSKGDRQGGALSHLGNFFRNIGNFFRGTPILPENVQNVSIVLVRSTEFPLVFDVKDVSTLSIRSEIGLHFLCKISNINEFYQNMLLDRTFVSFENVAQNVEPIIKGILNSSLNSVEPLQVENSSASILSALQTQISSIYSFITVTKIISLTAKNEALENIRKMQEELYVSELELTELTKRNSFLNRLQDENNSQALREARSQTDFQAALDKIDQDKELNEDERLKFSQMLEAQRLIREAKTDDEIETALQEFKKSGLLRDEEIENLKAQIQQNAAIRDLNNEQVLALATLANEKELDKQKLQWEIEVGNKRLENELSQRRMQDAYDDERRKAEMDLDKQEMQNQMDLLKQAQAMREERENAQHQREMEELNARNAHEEEMRRMFQNMSAEQIVAANPDITPEAAQAMAEKFKAEALAAQNDKTAEMAQKQSADMQAFMTQQMNAMRDMFMAGMNANAMNQQQMMASKDAEMNRFQSGVNNAVTSVSGALKNPTTVVQQSIPTQTPVQTTENKTVKANVCPNCGTPHEEGAMFCENCGGSL